MHTYMHIHNMWELYMQLSTCVSTHLYISRYIDTDASSNTLMLSILVYYHMVKLTVDTDMYENSHHTKHSHNSQHVNTHALHVVLFCHRCITVFVKPQCEAGTMSPQPNRLEY